MPLILTIGQKPCYYYIVQPKNGSAQRRSLSSTRFWHRSPRAFYHTHNISININTSISIAMLRGGTGDFLSAAPRRRYNEGLSCIRCLIDNSTYVVLSYIIRVILYRHRRPYYYAAGVYGTTCCLYATCGPQHASMKCGVNQLTALMPPDGRTVIHVCTFAKTNIFNANRLD